MGGSSSKDVVTLCVPLPRGPLLCIQTYKPLRPRFDRNSPCRWVRVKVQTAENFSYSTQPAADQRSVVGTEKMLELELPVDVGLVEAYEADGVED